MKTPEHKIIEGLENKHNALVLIHESVRNKSGNLGTLAVISLMFNGFLIIALGRPYIGGLVLLATLFFVFPYANNVSPKVFKSTRHIGPDPGLRDPTQCFCTNSKCAKCLGGNCTRRNCIVHLDTEKIEYQKIEHH